MSDNVKIVDYDDFTDCDGKRCGLGKHVRAGNYLCLHNNLEVKHPELIKQWHPNNKPMTSYTSGSNQKVWWICDKNLLCDCHVWECVIQSRTGIKTGCPYCSGKNLCSHNNLEALFPSLIKEWHPDNKPMSTYPRASSQKVKWICCLNSCGCHIWECSISDRTSKNSGCPFCKSGKICEHNNLAVKFPQLKIEWDPNNSKQMSEYTSSSSDVVFWICQNGDCDCHKWRSSIRNRTYNDSGCPFCNKNKPCRHNNLEILFPNLRSEWYPDNPKQMSEYSSGSNIIVKWICSKNTSHIWSTVIRNRTKEDPTGCPHCCKSKGYSDTEISWITEIEQNENIIIQNVLSSEGQFKIMGVGRADGYCELTNTVYEFHGDFWHGNPSIYDKNEINPVTKSTFGELYDKTIKREQKIRDLGFNLIVKWETDFTEIKPKVEELNDVFYIKINNKSKSTFIHQ